MLNKVTLIGNLGQDPEIRYAQNGNAVATLSIATSESWKDKETGEKVEKTEWHRIVLFSRLAEIAEKYLQKGSQIYLEGKLQTRKWEDKDGNQRYTTEVVGGMMKMLGSRGEGKPQEAKQGAAPAPSETVDDDFDMDIPF